MADGQIGLSAAPTLGLSMELDDQSKTSGIQAHDLLAFRPEL